jgi:hypothetical protein
MLRPGSNRGIVIFRLLLCLLLAGCAPAAGLAAPAPAPTRVTLTPFQPMAATGTARRPLTPTPAPKPLPFYFHGLNLSDQDQEMRVIFDTEGLGFNRGRPLAVAFRPGWPCEYINHRACVNLARGGQVILVTVHSGVGGEAQALRHALEGTGIDSAAYSLDHIQRTLDGLPGMTAVLEQDSTHLEDLRVLAAARVPAPQVADYFSRSLDSALDLAAEYSPALVAALDSDQPLLIIETCGWKHPAEPWPAGMLATSAAIYLIVIGN